MTTALLLLAAAVLLLPGQASAGEPTFLDLQNQARSAQGLAPLERAGDLDAIAAGWATQLRDDYEQKDDRQAVLRHNPALAQQMPGRFPQGAENVGFTVRTGAPAAELAEALHTGYMESPNHRSNVLGDYTHVGVAKRTSSDGTMWSTVVFGSLADPDPAPPEEPEPEPEPEPVEDPEPAPEPEPEPASAEPSRDEEPAADRSQASPARDLPSVDTASLFGDDWPPGYLSPDEPWDPQGALWSLRSWLPFLLRFP